MLGIKRRKTLIAVLIGVVIGTLGYCLILLAVVRHSHDLTASNHAGHSGEDGKWHLDYSQPTEMGKCWKRPHAETSCFASIESFYVLVGFFF